jgi:photosystem II stability/assembly factor-like uncharacterized protein
MTSSTKYFVVQGDKVEFRTVPDGLAVNSIHALDLNKLVIVDESMNLHFSADEGKTWQKQSDVQAKVIVRDLYRPDILNSVGLEMGTEGHYLYTRGQRKDPGSRVLYSKDGSGTYTEVSLPNKALWLYSLEENRSGLYITTGTSGWTMVGTQVLFRPTGATEWRVGNLPEMHCLELTLNDSQALHAKITCESGATWLSTNGGSTWVERSAQR